jgi:hypothetical protein
MTLAILLRRLNLQGRRKWQIIRALEDVGGITARPREFGSGPAWLALSALWWLALHEVVG